MRIGIYLPTKRGISKKARLLKTGQRKLQSYLIEKYGGYTIYKGNGYWLDENNTGKIIRDKVRVYEIYVDLVGAKTRDLKVELLYLRELTKETCIAYMIDDDIYFI